MWSEHNPITGVADVSWRAVSATTLEGCGLRWLFRIRRHSPIVADGGSPAEHWRSAKMARLEAVLFVTDVALSARRIMQLGTLVDVAEVRSLIDRLNAAYDDTGSAFRVERVANGYRMLTRPEFAYWLDKLHQRQTTLKLSPPAMETLTVVAYRQPVTRADVEAVRGVQSSEILKQLMDRGLVKTAGTDDTLGRPFLYVTTARFLETFGFKNLDDLPMADRLRPVSVTSEEPEAARETDQVAPDAADAILDANVEVDFDDSTSEAA